MTIKRNGVEITLTGEELVQAYFEQQENFDHEDIESSFSDEFTDMLPNEESDFYGVTKKEFQDMIPEMTDRYRSYIDKSDYLSDVLYEIRSNAIHDVIKDNRNGGARCIHTI